MILLRFNLLWVQILGLWINVILPFLNRSLATTKTYEVLNVHVDSPMSIAGTPASFKTLYRDDVIKWKHFPPYWPFVRGIHRSPVNFPHKGQWYGDLMFSMICASINGCVNNCEAGDLRRHRAHYDVDVIKATFHGALIPGVLYREHKLISMISNLPSLQILITAIILFLRVRALCYLTWNLETIWNYMYKLEFEHFITK